MIQTLTIKCKLKWRDRGHLAVKEMRIPLTDDVKCRLYVYAVPHTYNYLSQPFDCIWSDIWFLVVIHQIYTIDSEIYLLNRHEKGTRNDIIN
jgi:hypothetical protein